MVRLRNVEGPKILSSHLQYLALVSEDRCSALMIKMKKFIWELPQIGNSTKMKKCIWELPQIGNSTKIKAKCVFSHGSVKKDRINVIRIST